MADDQMVRDRIRHSAKVQMDDVLALHFLDALHNGIHQAGALGAQFLLHPVYLAFAQRYEVTYAAYAPDLNPPPLRTKVFGRQLIELARVESTNTIAAEMITAGHLDHGAVVLAHEQTAGRGQRGRTWHSAPGLDLTFSIVLRPETLRAEDQFMLVRCAALAVYDVVATYLPDVRIKWPNDILVGRRKVAGILIRTEVLGDMVRSAIIGIGLNVNSSGFDEGLVATSLCMELGRTLDRNTLLEELCLRFEHQWGRNNTDVAGAYAERLWARGRWADVALDGAPAVVRPMDVDASGRLIVEHEDGSVQAYGLERLRFAPR